MTLKLEIKKLKTAESGMFQIFCLRRIIAPNCID